MSRKEESAALSGSTTSFISPSGLEISIREQNGDDEDIISNAKSLLKGEAINYFLAGIILRINGAKISSEDVLNLKQKDKYYTLLKSRIFSLGSEITYKHRCSNSNCSKPQGTEDQIYEEDLSLYDRDFSNPKEDLSPFKYRVSEYPLKDLARKEFTIGSGKILRYKFLTGVEEKILISMDKDKMSKNTEIMIRELELKLENEQWQRISNFKMFSSKEMAEIRKEISQNDMPFEAISECTCPYCGNMDSISLLAQTDFFFPGEM